jgi:hypothetical protein
MVSSGRGLEMLTTLRDFDVMVPSTEKTGEDGAPHEARSPLSPICEPRRVGDAKREGDKVGEVDLPSTTCRCCRSKSSPRSSLSESENGYGFFSN